MRRLKSFLNLRKGQVLLLTAGVICIAAGIYRDEVGTVLMKAIYICLECIGIG